MINDGPPGKEVYGFDKAVQMNSERVAYTGNPKYTPVTTADSYTKSAMGKLHLQNNSFFVGNPNENTALIFSTMKGVKIPWMYGKINLKTLYGVGPKGDVDINGDLVSQKSPSPKKSSPKSPPKSGKSSPGRESSGRKGSSQNCRRNGGACPAVNDTPKAPTGPEGPGEVNGTPKTPGKKPPSGVKPPTVGGVHA